MKKINEKLVHDGWRKVISRTFVNDGNEIEYEIKNEQDSVAVLAITNENYIILAEQYRPGPEKLMLELPGGALEKGESPLECGVRELLEETGYSGDAEYIGSCYHCAYSTKQKHTVLVRNCIQSATQSTDSNEQIQIKMIPFEQLIDLLREGMMTDVEVGYRAIDFLSNYNT